MDAQITAPEVPQLVPELVRTYCERAFAIDEPPPRRLRVSQRGELFREPDGRPLPFTAVEEFVVGDVACDWRARVAAGPLITLRIHDGCGAGQGWMRGRVLGIPFLRRGGPDIAVASVLRYLAELPWAPHAMLWNPHLTWTKRSDRLAEVATEVAGASRRVSFTFGPDGDIVRVFTGARPRDGDAPRAWSGTFGEYATFSGVRIPTFAEVRWELPAGPFPYWRGYVTGLDVIR